MKKYITLSMILILCLTLMTGCGGTASEDAPGKSTDYSVGPADWAAVDSPEEIAEKATIGFFAGKWQCRDSTFEQVGIDDAIYVGNLRLTVKKDGTFKIKSIEKDDSTVMEGTMEILGEDSLHIACKGDFYPPECWEGIEKDQDLTYRFDFAGGKDILLLTYTNADGVTSTLYLDRVK